MARRVKTPPAPIVEPALVSAPLPPVGDLVSPPASLPLGVVANLDLLLDSIGAAFPITVEDATMVRDAIRIHYIPASVPLWVEAFAHKPTSLVVQVHDLRGRRLYHRELLRYPGA